MSSTLVETAVFTSSVEVPSDGDEADAASVNGAFQVLADRSQWLLALHNGTLRGGYLTVGTNQVVVSPVRALVVGGVYGSNAVQTTLTLPSLSSGTWYYVYAYPDGSGGVSFEVSTTAPDNSGTTGDGGAMWKSGGTARRYLGSFRTYIDGASVVRPYPMLQCGGGRYLYRRSEVSEALVPAVHTLTAPVSLVQQDTVSLAGFVPPHARVALVDLRVQLAASTPSIDLKTYEGGNAFSAAGKKVGFVTARPSGDTSTLSSDLELEIELDSSREFGLSGIVSTGTDSDVAVFVNGFIERDTRG